MSSVQLSDLPIASSANDGDLMLLRSGLTDYQINVTDIRKLDLSIFTSIASPLAADLYYTQSGGQTYSSRFSQIGFVTGTQMWFYQASAPNGDGSWVIVPGTGDSLLAVSDGTNNYFGASAGTQNGSWQQTDLTLTIDQIPAHIHEILTGRNFQQSSSGIYVGRYDTLASSVIETQSTGGNLPHNHGNIWRPFANIGAIYKKVM